MKPRITSSASMAALPGKWIEISWPEPSATKNRSGQDRRIGWIPSWMRSKRTFLPRRKRSRPSKPGDVAPPMPGRVVKVLVAKDQQVKAGDPLLIIEAMKMESRVPAPIDGKVAAILVAEGENVKTDETVVQLE